MSSSAEDAIRIIASAIDAAAGPAYNGTLSDDEAVDVAAALASSLSAFLNSVGIGRVGAMEMLDAAIRINEGKGTDANTERIRGAHQRLVAIAMRAVYMNRVKKGTVASG